MKQNKKFFKSLAAGAMAMLLCLLAVLPASAMSSLEPEAGVDVYSVFPKGRRSELRLQSLVLTYDVPKLPEEEYTDLASLQDYPARLKLDYTFYNSTDKEQTVQMLFAVGNVPSYVKDMGTGAQRAALYQVELGGERITPELRFAWTPNPQRYQTSISSYDPRDFADNLQNSYATHALLSPDLPVTVYTYQPYSELDENDRFYCDMTASFDYDPARTLIFSDHHTPFVESATPKLRARVSHESLVTLYVLGEDIGEVNWKLTDDGKRAEGCSVRVVERRSTTFGELAMQEYDPSAGISEQDWYNAVVDMMEYSHMEGSCLLGYNKHHGSRVLVDLDVSSNLQGFLAYDVTLGAGERTVNSITLPVYPSLMEYYSPRACTFRYHFHGDYDWRTAGEYSVRINTKYKIMSEGPNSSSPDKYQKDWGGYTLPERSVPDRSYAVTLCKWKNPIMNASFGFILFLLAFLGIPTLGTLGTLSFITTLAVGMVVLTVNLVLWRRRKRAGEQAGTDHAQNDDTLT